MSKIILFSNIKGGVGKTTLCAHFAEYLSMKGVPVVAVDADIQGSYLYWYIFCNKFVIFFLPCKVATAGHNIST